MFSRPSEEFIGEIPYIFGHPTASPEKLELVVKALEAAVFERMADVRMAPKFKFAIQSLRL